MFPVILQGDLKTPGTTRHLLKTEWASVTKCLKFQPLDEVKDYFGIQVGLYFAWLGNGSSVQLKIQCNRSLSKTKLTNVVITYTLFIGFYTHYLIPVSIIGLACFLYGCFTLYSNEQR